MSKNNQEHRDSTTDFFLNFISKEKEKNVKYVTNLYENVYKFFFENKIKNFADKICAIKISF